MNYTEKVSQKVKGILDPFEEQLLKEVKNLVTESFKNGIEVGKQSKKKGTEDKKQEKSDEDE